MRRPRPHLDPILKSDLRSADMKNVRRSLRLRDQAGFTMIEVLVASVVLITGFLAVASIFTMSKTATTATRARVQATNLAREIAEAGRGVTYAEITDAAILARIAASNPALADIEAGNPFTVERRNIVYTITAETCTMDDNRDGGGAVPRNGDFCPESVAAGSLDPRNGKTDPVPEDYKRIDITTTWERESGALASVKQTTLVNNPGSAGAPAIVTLQSAAVGTPPVVGPTVADGGSTTTQITFTTTTSHAPAALKWLLDGVGQPLVCGPCPAGSKGPFSFTWNLNSPVVADDGPYLVAAEAYDERSVAGPTRSMTVVLNRSYPKAPPGLSGGRNDLSSGSEVVEMEWLPGPERDLTGYVVTRDDGTVICPRSTSTYCRDDNPPDRDIVQYQVRPWDVALDGSTPRQSIYFGTVRAVRDNQPPRDPENVLVFPKDIEGNVKLTWRKPEPQDPDTGDKIAFYRVYRDGKLVSNRIGRVEANGDNLTFYDTAPTSTTHRYYVTAVDTRYAESGYREAGL